MSKEENTVDTAGNTIVSIMSVSIFLAVMLFSIALIFGAILTADLSMHGVTLTSVAVANETGFANTSGYTVSGSTAYGFTNPQLYIVLNRTSQNVVSNGNFSISALGVVKNASGTWNNLSISYTYQYDTTSTNTANSALTSIGANIVLMVTNFFALMPTIGTIMAVVILIAGIVILVLYVKNMRSAGSGSNEGYTG